MKKSMITIFLFVCFILIGCQEQSSVSVKTPNEEDIILTDLRFTNAIKMYEQFIVNDIQAKVVQVDSNLAYIGHNRNQQLMGVYIFIDYTLSETLESEIFWVEDILGNTYYPITADGLDTLGSYRNHHQVQLGYIRFSLPNIYTNFLLAYQQEDIIHYIHVIVERSQT